MSYDKHFLSEWQCLHLYHADIRFSDRYKINGETGCLNMAKVPETCLFVARSQLLSSSSLLNRENSVVDV